MENPPHSNFESEPTPEQPVIDSLPEALGFKETPDLTVVANALVEAMRSGAETKDLASYYYDLAGAVADQSDDERARLGLEIQLALLRRAGGRDEAYRETVEDACVHAFQMGLEDVAAILEAELAEF